MRSGKWEVGSGKLEVRGAVEVRNFRAGKNILFQSSLVSASSHVSSAHASSAVENYLETIQALVDRDGEARVGDIAEELGISQASVSNMVHKLGERGLIHHEKYRGVTLSDEGRELAEGLARRHDSLSEFLALLGVDEGTAAKDVEGMEHHVSGTTLRKIEALVKLLSDEPRLVENIRNFSNKS